jgi:FAD/FMN-containing dehydrogenase
MTTTPFIASMTNADEKTATGACLCTGVMGPLLGGGHGLLQGQHGLLTDQLIEARMVLADGSAITVSDSSNRDLFWAIRGAGHNFGVVTSIKLKVYDQPQRDWTYLSIAYPGVMVQQVFQASNEFNKNVPAEITNYIVMRRIPGIDPNNVSAALLASFVFEKTDRNADNHPLKFLLRRFTGAACQIHGTICKSASDVQFYQDWQLR